MARIRTIKPEFWSSPTLARVSRDARLTFIGLWNQADDHGRIEAVPRTLLGDLFPFDEDVTESDVVAWVDELAREGLARVYRHSRRRYLQITGWSEHQRVDKPSNPRCPDPDDSESVDVESLTSDYGESREGVANGSGESLARNVGALDRRTVGSKTVADDADASPETDPVQDQFEDFWQRYPRHAKNGKPGGGGDRKPALRTWRNLSQSKRDLAMAAVEHYRTWCQSPDGEFPKHASTWLNAAGWESWQEPAVLTAVPDWNQGGLREDDRGDGTYRGVM